MGRVIWIALNPIFFFYAFLPVIIFGIIATLPIPPRVSSMVILTLSSSYIAAMLYLVICRGLVIVVEFTEDGLVVRGRGGFSVSRDVVVNGNVVCIRKTPRGIRLRIRHGSLDYTIPLDQIQYEALINALATHWGWTPSQCPNISGPAS
jgi:hypothetical protein